MKTQASGRESTVNTAEGINLIPPVAATLAKLKVPEKLMTLAVDRGRERQKETSVVPPLTGQTDQPPGKHRAMTHTQDQGRER